MDLRSMIATHPDVQGSTADQLIASVEEAGRCAQVCLSCADACLAEEMVAELRQCIRLNLDCADACAAVAAMGVRRAGSNVEVLRAMVEVCEMACIACGEECGKHASAHEHCRICAEHCRRCAEACRAALPEIH